MSTFLRNIQSIFTVKQNNVTVSLLEIFEQIRGEKCLLVYEKMTFKCVSKRIGIQLFLEHSLQF